MSAPILRRGAAVLVASAIAGTAGTAGVALAGPAAATPDPNGHRVIVVVERGHEFCRYGHRTVVIIVKKDHRVTVIRKIVRCDIRRHDDFFFRHHFVKHVEFRRAHRFNVDNNRVHVILPKTPLRVTTPTTPPQVSVRTGPSQG
ncbi:MULTISPECIES: hypothetical protein [unclassified Streptomyces]|uniref:hypothetical protein n=1 Tax=unclassified Streptomyces TaxID=2593676 RepID=UPI002DD93D3F|nr:hypothetical protein [Streptomyces sp. NBC_01445]WSE11423.1 hypothetical protein OG574_50410 [Streptomyces sp. NBC_01445]